MDFRKGSDSPSTSVPGSPSSSEAASNKADDDKQPKRTFCDEVNNAVVEISVSRFEQDFIMPWQSHVETALESGFVIANRRIISGGFWVSIATTITVRRRNSKRPYVVRVLAYDHALGLCLLTVDGESFWKNQSYLSFGPLPKRKAPVTALQFLSSKEAVTTANQKILDVSMFFFSLVGVSSYMIELDSLPVGYSPGTPILNEQDQVVGVLFGVKRDTMSYANTACIVQKLVDDVEKNGCFPGFGDCGFDWVPMTSKSMRLHKKMKPEDSGVLIVQIVKPSPASNVLCNEDVILSIEDAVIDNYGKVTHSWGDDIVLDYMFSMKSVGKIVKMRVLRDGNYHDIEYKLGDWSDRYLLPRQARRRQPEYYICGGFVFVSLSWPYIDLAEVGRYCMDYLRQYDIQPKRFIDEQVVVMSCILHQKTNLQYGKISGKVVLKFNEVKVRNLKHLAQLVEYCKEDVLRFELHDGIVVLQKDESEKTNAELLESAYFPRHSNIKLSVQSSGIEDCSVVRSRV